MYVIVERVRENNKLKTLLNSLVVVSHCLSRKHLQLEHDEPS